MDAINGIAQNIVDTYAYHLREHRETPDITPPPAFEDILDDAATQNGLQSDDADLLDAVEVILARQGFDGLAVTVAGWKRHHYNYYEPD